MSSICILRSTNMPRLFEHLLQLDEKDCLKVQLNEYETAPYFIQLSQNLTSDCLLISVFLPVFTSICMMWSWNCSQIKTKQFYDHIIQKLVKKGKNPQNSTEINKQSNDKFWLNWIKYGAVSYSLSCNIIS